VFTNEIQIEESVREFLVCRESSVFVGCVLGEDEQRFCAQCDGQSFCLMPEYYLANRSKGFSDIVVNCIPQDECQCVKCY